MIRGKYLDGSKDPLDLCFEIRQKVFVEEQGIPEEAEFDQLDQICGHYLVYNEEDIPISTGRLQKLHDRTCQIGRIATLKSYRHQGYAEFLMLALVEKARTLGAGRIVLHAQQQAVPFYEKNGFITIDPNPFIEDGIPHYKMEHIVGTQTCHDCQQSHQPPCS